MLWMHRYIEGIGLALHTINSFTDPHPWVLDSTISFTPDTTGATTEAIQCLRFFNGEMYYKAAELGLLAQSLARDEFAVREQFFRMCMERRRVICREFKANMLHAGVHHTELLHHRIPLSPSYLLQRRTGTGCVHRP